MTQRIRTWIHEQSAMRNLLRETACHANALLDLYLARGGRVQVATLQLLSIGCFRIASKLNQGYPPSVSV